VIEGQDLSPGSVYYLCYFYSVSPNRQRVVFFTWTRWQATAQMQHRFAGRHFKRRLSARPKNTVATVALHPSRRHLTRGRVGWPDAFRQCPGWLRFLEVALPANRISSCTMFFAEGFVGRAPPDLGECCAKEVSQGRILSPSAGDYITVRHDMNGLTRVLRAFNDLLSGTHPARTTSSIVDRGIHDFHLHSGVARLQLIHRDAQCFRERWLVPAIPLQLRETVPE
jgi:hypothetical protein